MKTKHINLVFIIYLIHHNSISLQKFFTIFFLVFLVLMTNVVRKRRFFEDSNFKTTRVDHFASKFSLFELLQSIFLDDRNAFRRMNAPAGDNAENFARLLVDRQSGDILV